MGKVIAIEQLTLDGVLQSPGHVDEDPRDGFQHGGWASRNQDPVMQQVMGAHMTDSWSLLAGRTTPDGGVVSASAPARLRRRR